MADINDLDKEMAVNNIYNSPKIGGLFVLSVSKDDDWFDYGDRRIKLYPMELDEYIRLIRSVGFHIKSIQETEGKFVTIMVGKEII